MTIKIQSSIFPANLLPGKTLLVVLQVLLLFNPFAIASDLNDTVPKRVLIIYSYHEGLPWDRLMDDSLRATLAAKETGPIELNVEHADRIRHPDDAYLQNFVGLLRHKYSHAKMNVVIGIDDEATDILLRYGEDLFPGVPTVFVTAERKTLLRDSLKPHMTSLLWGVDLKGSIDLIYKILPKTRQIFVITGSSASDRAAQKLAREALRDYTDRQEISYLAEIRIEELLDKVARLPEHSVLFYLTFSRDSKGKNFVPLEILSDISGKANAPTFGILDTYIESGIVGGHLLSAEVQGKRCAEICLRILGGEFPVDIAPKKTRQIPMFDAHQLKRWGINEKMLPSGSIVRNREYSTWRRYRWQIIGLISIALIQSTVMFLLWFQWAKRRMAEKKAHESEVRYRTVADYTYDWEYWQTPDKRMNYVSPSCEAITGYKPNEFIENPDLLDEIILPEDRNIWSSHQHETYRELARREIQFRIRRKNGEICWIEHACQPVHDDKARFSGFRVSNRDITKRKQLGDELAHMDRVSTMGALSSAIAHEINQPLAAILSNAQAAIRYLNHENPDLDEIREALLDISRDDKRTAEVIDRLRKMVKKEESVFESFDLTAVIEAAVNIISRENAFRSVTLQKDLQTGIPELQGDPIQIQQVVINLLINAMDAMTDQPADARRVFLSTRSDQDRGVIVTVIDSGPGLTTDQIETAFDPFYTTKPKGMGLGLSVSRTIIEIHGGHIRVENCPDGGAMFTFWIPFRKEV